MKTLTDEALELWGEVYTQCKVQKGTGVTFEEFVEHPMQHLKEIGQESAPRTIRNGYRPLLPIQIELKRKMDAQWSRDGILERLDHEEQCLAYEQDMEEIKSWNEAQTIKPAYIH